MSLRHLFVCFLFPEGNFILVILVLEVILESMISKPVKDGLEILRTEKEDRSNSVSPFAKK